MSVPGTGRPIEITAGTGAVTSAMLTQTVHSVGP